MIKITLKGDVIKEFPKGVSAYEVAKDYTYVNRKNLKKMQFPECKRNAEVEECISYAVCEAAYDEQRNTEQERKVLLVAGELYG